MPRWRARRCSSSRGTGRPSSRTIAVSRPFPGPEPGRVHAPDHQGGALRLPGPREPGGHPGGHRSGPCARRPRRPRGPSTSPSAPSCSIARGWRRRSARRRSTASSARAPRGRRPSRPSPGRLGEARVPGSHLRRRRLARGAQAAEAVRLAELLEAPVFASRQIFPNFPTRHPLYCGGYPVSKDFEKVTGLKPDLLFLVGCQGVHGSVDRALRDADRPEPAPHGPPLPAGRGGAVRAARDAPALAAAAGAATRGGRGRGWARQRAKVRAYAKLLIEREESLVREHEHDTPSCIRASSRRSWPAAPARHRDGAGELDRPDRPCCRSGTQAMALDAQRRRLARLRRRRGAIGAKIAVGRDRPVVLHLGDGALTYSAAGFWSMARYNTAILTIVSNNETYQIVRHNWAQRHPGRQDDPRRQVSRASTSATPQSTTWGSRARRASTASASPPPKELEPALRRGIDADHAREPALPARGGGGPRGHRRRRPPGTRTGSSDPAPDHRQALAPPREIPSGPSLHEHAAKRGNERAEPGRPVLPTRARQRPEHRFSNTPGELQLRSLTRRASVTQVAGLETL